MGIRFSESVNMRAGYSKGSTPLHPILKSRVGWRDIWKQL